MTLPQRIKIAEQLVRRIGWQDLDLAALRRFIETAWDEAEPSHAASPPAASRHRTVGLVTSDEMVVCGTEFVPLVSSIFRLREGTRACVPDGSRVSGDTAIATLCGPEKLLRPAAGILRAVVRRLSGMATFAGKHSMGLGDGRTRLLDSGEFTPGWRMLEKYALARGGAWDGGNESSRVRIDSAGKSATELEVEIRRTRAATPGIPVEVDVSEPGQVAMAASASADLIRLENFPASALREAVARVNGRSFVEAHGGIGLSNIADFARAGLDFISIDGLVSNAGWAQIDSVWHD